MKEYLFNLISKDNSVYFIDMTENNTNSESTARTRDYWAKLPEFEGPLDILLHFVKEDELNIYDIPISKITKDFLGYIEYMQSLDIEVAGEFLLMATELMKIKARMLIPVPEFEEGVEEEDPRLILVKKLLEYKRFKEASEGIAELEKEARRMFFRTYFENDVTTVEAEGNEETYNIKNLTIFNLIKAYRDVIINAKQEVIHPIEKMYTSPDEQREYIIKKLFENAKIHFDDIYNELNDKLKIICAFIAILQLSLEGFLKIEVNPNDICDFSIEKTNPTIN